MPKRRKVWSSWTYTEHSAEDRERRQFAEAVHEDIGQLLAGLGMKFTALKEATDRARIDDLVVQVDALFRRVMQS